MTKKRFFAERRVYCKAICAVVMAFLVGASVCTSCSHSAAVSASTPATEEFSVSDISAEGLNESASEVESQTKQGTQQQLEDTKLDIAKEYYSDLHHGEKGAAFQKYIMIHDTEGGGTPEGVISYWEGNGNLVAAHFVIGKDGHIAQCVPLDAIAHHAGWGSGDANARFGITEDGRDDLLGRQSTSYYTDYGMNAWSIGIELIHIGGEGDYPLEQLEALDALIAYIDAYYGGYGGEIIDHKMWREGNSDTSFEFSEYLANYRDHRTHD